MNENEFELGGKAYVSVKSKNGASCEGCSFVGVGLYCISDSHPKCIGKLRSDKTSVIFVEKYP